jgi:hypothetical protein
VVGKKLKTEVGGLVRLYNKLAEDAIRKQLWLRRALHIGLPHLRFAESKEISALMGVRQIYPNESEIRFPGAQVKRGGTIKPVSRKAFVDKQVVGSGTRCSVWVCVYTPV